MHVNVCHVCDNVYRRPVETRGMFSKPSILVSYHRDKNSRESGVLIITCSSVFFYSHFSVLLDVALTRIYVWADFLMDMVIFWLQVVPPQQDKNPEVPLEQLLEEQKKNPPKLEFVLNFQQDADIVFIESALMENPTCLVVKFLVRYLIQVCICVRASVRASVRACHQNAPFVFSLI